MIPKKLDFLKNYFNFRQQPVSDTALQLIIDAEKQHHDNVVRTISNEILPRLCDFHGLIEKNPKVCILFRFL